MSDVAFTLRLTAASASFGEASEHPALPDTTARCRVTNGKRLMAYSRGWNYAPERTSVFGVGVRMLLVSLFKDNSAEFLNLLPPIWII